MAADRCPGPYPCLCLCFMGQEPSVSKARRGEGGMLGGLGMRMWEGGQGKTGPQLSALCTHIWLSVLVALCEKTKGPPSPSSQRDTPFEKSLTVCRSAHMYMCAHTHTQMCTFLDMHDTTTELYTSMQTKTHTKHIHKQAYSSPAFCIGDTFHYSKHLSGDVVCTSRGDMHFLQTRYTLIMHALTTDFAF